MAVPTVQYVINLNKPTWLLTRAASMLITDVLPWSTDFCNWTKDFLLSPAEADISVVSATSDDSSNTGRHTQQEELSSSFSEDTSEDSWLPTIMTFWLSKELAMVRQDSIALHLKQTLVYFEEKIRANSKSLSLDDIQSSLNSEDNLPDVTLLLQSEPDLCEGPFPGSSAASTPQPAHQLRSFVDQSCGSLLKNIYEDDLVLDLTRKDVPESNTTSGEKLFSQA